MGGAKWAGTAHWPGPLHEGRGTLQPFLDTSTSREQRDALLAILSGRAGGTLFEILAAVTERVLEPRFTPIEFEFDIDRRTARVKVEDEIETESAPIKNPVTGDEHRVLVQMPEGFEYELAEVAAAPVLESTGEIKFDHPGGHSSLAKVSFSN